MLGKLIRYEFKITARSFVPLYLSLGILTLLVKLSWVFSFSAKSFFFASGFMGAVTALLIILYGIFLIGIGFVSYFLIIKRFYSGLFGNEGHLTFTLPVSAGQILGSKLIVAFIWMVLLISSMILSFLILFFHAELFRDFPYILEEVLSEFQVIQISGFHPVLLLVELFFLSALGILGSILTCYLSVTLGQRFLPGHRLIGSILFFFGISTIESSLHTALFSMISYLNLDSVQSMAQIFRYLHTQFPLDIVWQLLLICLYYGITYYYLDRNLNLT